MEGLRSQFGEQIVAVGWLSAATVIVAILVALRLAVRRRPWLSPASKVIVAGAASCAVVATVIPFGSRSLGSRELGDPAWQPGRGGLAELAVIADDLDSLSAFLILLNPAMFAPIGFFGVLAWRGRPGRVLLACLSLGLLIELTQLLVVGGVAATDDLILYLVGAVAGVLTATALTRHWVDDTPRKVPIE